MLTATTRKNSNGTGAAATSKPRRMNECMISPSYLRRPEKLFDAFWREGELALLFGAAGAGKSILATQIAEAVGRGSPIGSFSMPTYRRKVLYVDLVMADQELTRRYSYEERPNRELKSYNFSGSLYRDRPETLEKLAEWLREKIMENGFQVIVIDDLGAVTNSHDGTRETLKLMRQLKKLKDELGVAILVLATSAEHRPQRAVSEADLGRSRVLCGVADSVFAIGRRQNGDSQIVQMRSRNAAPVWNVHNGPLCGIGLTDEMLLGFIFDGRFAERFSEETRQQIVKIHSMREAKMTLKAIGEQLGISTTKALRLSRKWTPDMGSCQWPVASGQEEQMGDVSRASSEQESLAADGRGQTRINAREEEELEEWVEGGFERPEWLDDERSAGDDLAADGRGRARIIDREEEAKAGEPAGTAGRPEARGMDVGAIPFAAGMRRRSIYDLELRLNDYGKEIFVEAACEKTDKPLIWYHVDNRGMINRWVRRGGIEGARLGPAPYIEVGGWQRDLNGWLKLVGEKWELPIIRSLAAGQKPK